VRRPRFLARVFDIEDATKVQLSGESVRAIGKDLRQYQAVSAGLFVMSPTLLEALDSLQEPSLTQGGRGRRGGARAGRGLRRRHQAVARRRLARDEGARGRDPLGQRRFLQAVERLEQRRGHDEEPPR